jgi:predicted nucleotide-binding protein (sugar kinase/HSP70/actin superfamily)
MRLGLVDTVLFERYGTWWSSFLSAIGVELLLPKASHAESLRLGQTAMPEELPTIQLLVGRILELSTQVDGLLIPDLHPGAESGLRGAALEPWLVDLPTMLGLRFSLPTIYKIPPHLEPAQTTRLAVQLGQTFTGNAQVVRRSLDRLQTGLKPPEPAEPVWQKAGNITVGLVGDPILLEQDFLMQEPLRLLEQAGLHAVPISAMPKARAIEEGQRINKNLLQLDHEMIGAARLLAQKAAVQGLVYLYQPFGLGQQQLLERSINNTQKPCVLLEWGNLDADKLAAFVEMIPS